MGFQNPNGPNLCENKLEISPRILESKPKPKNETLNWDSRIQSVKLGFWNPNPHDYKLEICFWIQESKAKTQE